MDAAMTAVRWQILNDVLRRVTALAISSLIAGILVGGVGGRLVMTVSARAAGEDMFGRITENGNTIGVFTVGGTLILIIFVGLLGGIVASVAVVGSDPWLRWAGAFRGLGYGLAVLAFFGHDTFDSVDFLILEPTLLNVSMFLGLMIGFGYAVVWLAKTLDKRLPRPTGEPQVGYILVSCLGALPLLLAIMFFTTPSFCGCQPFIGIGISLAVMIAATVIHHAAVVTGRIPTWVSRAADVAGYSALLVGLILGLARVWADIQTIF